MSFKFVKSERGRFTMDGRKVLELWYDASEPITRAATLKEIRRQFEKMKDRNVAVQVAARYEKINWRSGKMINDVRGHDKIPGGMVLFDGDGSVQLDDPTATAGGITALKLTVIQNL